jgi:hypothetical protein
VLQHLERLYQLNARQLLSQCWGSELAGPPLLAATESAVQESEGASQQRPKQVGRRLVAAHACLHRPWAGVAGGQAVVAG